MLDADIDPFFDVPIADTLVYDHAHSRLCDVVDHSGLAVVDFVRHSERGFFSG